jgi:hypothetical protein
MRIVVLTKDGYDYSSAVDNFIAELRGRFGEETIEQLDPDTFEGESFARSQDIMEYPAIVAVDGNGTGAVQWTGMPLPSFDEVTYYLNS